MLATSPTRGPLTRRPHRWDSSIVITLSCESIRQDFGHSYPFSLFRTHSFGLARPSLMGVDAVNLATESE